MSELLLRQRDTTLWITLDRPLAHNALSTSLAVEIRDLADELDRRDDVQAVVITGAGAWFCAGIDGEERAGMSPERELSFVAVTSHAIDRVAKIRKPTICALNGPAYDAGLELAMACDFRILADTAEVGLTQVRLGVMPGALGTQRLPRLVGEARAKELILLGRRISAARALQIGLAHAVAPAAELEAAVGVVLAELAACAPISVRSAKTAIEDGYGKSLDTAADVESQCYQTTSITEDRDEGLLALAEGRPPRFQGR